MTSSIVSILMPDKKTVAGIGILVADNRILTTAESVANALQISPDLLHRPESEVFLEFSSIAPKKPVRSKIVHWQPISSDSSKDVTVINNIAVLELLEPLPKSEANPNMIRNIPTNTHYRMVINAIKEGTLIPFFGAGVNLCGRPKNTTWEYGKFLPSGAELAVELAKEFDYPWSDDRDLVRVSQYVAIVWGLGPLNNKLRKIFNADYPPNELHRFFAHLPKILKGKKYPPHRLIVTTNYDDVLENAFKEANEPYDVVTYVTKGSSEQRGKFLHWTFKGDVKLVEKPNEYRLETDDEGNLTRSVILKLHGAIDRIRKPTEETRDSFVITEDQYIDYLTRSDISNLVPVTLAAKLRSSSFLFLGYGLRDWNLRVILYRIWVEQQRNENYKSWAIQLEPEEFESKMWEQRDVRIFHNDLETYINQLRQQVEDLPPEEY